MASHALRGLAVLLASLMLPLRCVAEIIGTNNATVASNSAAFSYQGQWYNQMSAGQYIAYSNSSDARLTFTFIGVAVQVSCASMGGY